MLGWKLFLRAVNLLIENLGEALRVSLVPYAVLIAASLWLVGEPVTDLSRLDLENGEATPGGMTAAMSEMAGGLVLTALLNMIVSLWVAVAWHRYALLGETARGWIPMMHVPEMLGYFWRVFLIGLLVMLAVVGIMIPLGAVAAAIPSFLPLVPLIGIFLGSLVFYRLGVVLPARAVGKFMTFGEAMEATRDTNGAIATLAAISLALPLLFQVPTMLDGDAGPITVIYEGVVGWIALMIGVSTLTALYGHLVEGRPVE
ncbi:hypothetical protein [Jannaschia seohaensis]|uniref:Uncharacterized protein n=1 Tax=Jannaschia seohaensis TaxID=475081 RepID=A0A2Y9C8J7_9RHOB|nr:hypothetical protein [Jannaschia seohaensis]PWJ16255.1 hypothetical protein BCF38_109140 [Jannaschia seohaensis]SSA49333.1 hypothetical protein SAMN05421539_109140 [Jannaschia seohaensis]